MRLRQLGFGKDDGDDDVGGGVDSFLLVLTVVRCKEWVLVSVSQLLRW
jgi:hypothetical protein